MDISIYIILYSDFGFLNDILKEVHDKVKEIIIIDGPYIYNIEYLKKLGLFYDSPPPELMDIINKYNVRYFNKIFDNEEEKRMFGYSQCECDNILLIDADEFFKFDDSSIKNFINGNKKVGGFGIYNMNRINLCFDPFCTKLVLFKKKYITAQEHLDYLWLVCCKQNKKNENLISHEHLGIIYHQTLNRTKDNNIIKFIFYTTLYHYNDNGESKLFDNYDLDYLINILGTPKLLDMFYHSKIEFIGIPPDTNKILMPITPLINLHKYNDNHCDAILKNSEIFVKGIPFFGYLKSNIVYFKNVKCVNIKLWSYEINKLCIIKSFTITSDSFEFDLNPVMVNVVMFECTETLSDSIICYVMLNQNIL